MKRVSDQKTVDIFSGQTYEEEKLAREQAEASEASASTKERKVFSFSEDARNGIDVARYDLTILGSRVGNRIVKVASDGGLFLVYVAVPGKKDISSYSCYKFTRKEFEELVSVGRKLLDK